MTTLPQPSPRRLPGPNGNGHLTAGNHPATATAPPPNSLSAADIWRIVRANLWLIMGLPIAFAALGYVANSWLLTHDPRYTSRALLQVREEESIPRSMTDPAGSVSPQALEIEQNTQTQRLTHESLLNSVLADSKAIRETEWFKQFVADRNGQPIVDAQAAKQDLLKHLNVNPVYNSRLIEVMMTYSVPKDCQTVVQEICDEFIKQTRQRQNADQMNRLQALEAMQTKYDSRIAEENSALDTLSKTLGNAGVSPNAPSTPALMLSFLLTERKEVEKEKNEADVKLRAVTESLKGGEPSAETSQWISLEPRLSQLRIMAADAQVQADDLAERMGQTNPNAVAARRHLENVRRELADTEKDVTDHFALTARRRHSESSQAAKVSLDAIDRQIKDVNAQLAEFSRMLFDYNKHLEELRVLRVQRDNVQEEMDKLGATLSSGRYSPVDWAQQPSLPDYASFPRLPMTVGAAVIMGLILSLGIAFLRELTDTTVRSPRDVARVGQLTLLGMIPHEHDDPQLTGGRLGLAIHDAPHSMVAEQFRQVRTRLQHAASLETTRSILVTGCSPGDGKTTVAANIAAGLALNGRRILLVDANFRRPSLHTLFDIPNETGFADVLMSADAFQDATRDTEIPNLSVIPSGKRPGNSTELLETPLLVDFIERALEQYDQVIFDSGPLLMVSDSIALAPRVDGVITVVRARRDSRGLLQRARDELRRLRAEHIGVVLNAVRTHRGGYYGPMIRNYYAYQTR